MAIRRSRVVIAASASVWLSPIRASAQCALFDSPARCAQDRLETELIMEEARRAGEIRAKTINAIVAARAQFWATYPDKPGPDKARHDFAYWLWVKDFHYLRTNLQAPVQRDQRTQRQTSTDPANVLDRLFGGGVLIDDGIRQSARPEFEEWVNAVRKKLFEHLPKNSTDAAFMQGILSTWVGEEFWNALASAKKEYERGRPVSHRDRLRSASRQYGASAARHRVRVSITDRRDAVGENRGCQRHTHSVG